MYTEREITDKIELARTCRLSGAELLNDRRRVRRVCNGIGAEWMPAAVRKLICRMNPTLVLAADIHDLRYEAGGNDADRKFADDEMLENGFALAAHRYRWFDPRRGLVRMRMRKFHWLLRRFGQAAFNRR